jgi:hypothetical protein
MRKTMSSFICDTCKREYPTEKLRGVSVYINRPSNGEMQHLTCVFCAAERDNAEFDSRARNKKWDDLSDAHPRIFNRFDGRDVLGNEIFKPAHVAGGVGDGWFDLISEACDRIEVELDKLPEPGFLHFFDLKEKFGTLRWSASCPNDTIMDIIDEAEEKSYGICEECGKPGTQTDDGWIRTLCPEHTAERRNRK